LCLALSGVPQGSVLGSLLINIFTNDLCDVIYHSKWILFADDLKVYRTISSPSDCLLLQSDIDRVYNWCLANCMEPNFSKIRVVFLPENERSELSVQTWKFFRLRTDCIKGLCVHTDCKLHFHRHVNFLFWSAMKLLGLIRTLTFSFSTIDGLLILYFVLFRSKLEYASVAWNSVTITDSNKLERVQRKFASFCHNWFFQDVEYHYDRILEKLNLQTLHIRRRYFDPLFLLIV
jgi:hypothetical protein